MIINNAVVLTNEKDTKPRFIRILNEKIEEIGYSNDLVISPDEEVLDADGGFVSPGLIDTHTHGGFGVDFTEIDAAGFDKVLASLPKFGTTSVLATIGSTSYQNLYDSFSAAKAYLSKGNHVGTQLLGFHIEGPFINEDQRGSQPKEYIEIPDLKKMRDIVENAEGLIRLVSLAPELPNAMDLIRYLVSEGIIVSIGHSNASAEISSQAIALGATRATHLFNTMAPLHHREPGIIGAVLSDDRVYTEITLDGFHVHPLVAKLAYDLKGPDRFVLITDSTHLIGLPEGEYQRPGKDRNVIYKDGSVRLASNGRLAGSVLTMDQALRNAISFLDIDPFTATKLASTNPALSLGMSQLGFIDGGKQADLVIYDKELNVKKTIIKGKLVYKG